MSVGSWRGLLVASTSLVVAACAGLPPNLIPGHQARELNALLLRFDQVVQQSTDDQHRELLEAQTAFETDPDEIGRLRLALALSMPQTAWRDDARVVALVGEWPPEGEPSLAREVANLLLRQATDRQKLIKDEQRRVDGVRDELRRSETQLREEQRRSEVLLRDERKKYEELQQKLEALRAIDREARRAGRH
jgi:hypothetical protein